MSATQQALPAAAVRLVVSRGISSLGSTLTTFGLDVWVFRQTGSYAIFAGLALLAYLPGVLFAPIAGLIADRVDKRALLLVCEVVSLMAVVLALLLYLGGNFGVAAVAVTMLLLGIASELRWSALGPTISQMVPKDQLGRINGLSETFYGVTTMLGPVLGAIGFDFLGLSLLLTLSLAGYLIGIIGVIGVGKALFRSTARQGEPAPVFSGFWDEVTFGFRWVFAHAGLRQLLIFFMLINTGISIFTVTFAPYVLSFESNRALGFALGLDGAGGFALGGLLAFRRTPWKHESAVVGGALLFGVCMCVWGLSRVAALLFAVAFISGACATLIMASSQAIWQTHVPLAIQGKVFAVRKMLAFALAPLSILLSVPLASFVFAPLLEMSAVLRAVWGAPLAGALGMMVSTLGLGVAAVATVLWATGGFKLPRADRSNIGQQAT